MERCSRRGGDDTAVLPQARVSLMRAVIDFDIGERERGGTKRLWRRGALKFWKAARGLMDCLVAGEEDFEIALSDGNA